MAFSQNALTVLSKRYFLKDGQGQPVETPEDLFRRLANTLAEEDRRHGADDAAVAATAEKFYNLTYSLDFLPNSPTLANAGTRTGRLSACFVLPVPDDLAGIFETIKHQVLIHQTGGGTGFSFSRLRPKGDRVNSTQGESSGPVSFMDAANAATETIKQGGMRRGANMGILRIDHPDILDFISHKEDLTKLTNFNISVAVTDTFMAAVEAGTDYALVNPRNGEEWGRLDARTVFKTVVQRAWSTGEPGLVFIDRMNRYCPVPWLGEYEATNPCGEQPLLPYESCNLGSINLERFVKDGAVDWPRLREAIHASMHLLDNVIHANKFPVPELKAMSDATRKIGLGLMGFARMLFKLGIGYGSPESLTLAAQVMSFLDFESKVASVELAKVRGSFPAREGHEAESNAFFLKVCAERQEAPGKHPEADYSWLLEQILLWGIRNSNTTTIAPTGTLSVIADTSGGCEPVFALAFKRWQADTHMVDSDPVFRDWLRTARGLTEPEIETLMSVLNENHGSLNECPPGCFSDEAKRIFRTAHDISPEEHVKVQAAFQRFNDSATSKTINFAEGATVEDVETAYLLAWETGCKGITVYRNNSRQFQPLSVSDKKHPEPLAVAPVPVEEKCQGCKGPVIKSEGCTTCAAGCGWSACSIA